MILCRNLQPVRCSAAKRCNTGSFISFMAGGSDKRHVVVHEADDAVMILRIPIARPARLHDLQPRQRNLHRFHPPVRDAGREDERIALVVIPLDAVVHSLALLDKFLNALQHPNFDLSVRKSDAEVPALGLPVLFLVFEVFRTPACDLLLGLDAGQKRMAAIVRLPEIRRTDVVCVMYVLAQPAQHVDIVAPRSRIIDAVAVAQADAERRPVIFDPTPARSAEVAEQVVAPDFKQRFRVALTEGIAEDTDRILRIKVVAKARPSQFGDKAAARITPLDRHVVVKPIFLPQRQRRSAAPHIIIPGHIAQACYGSVFSVGCDPALHDLAAFVACGVAVPHPPFEKEVAYDLQALPCRDHREVSLIPGRAPTGSYDRKSHAAMRADGTVDLLISLPRMPTFGAGDFSPLGAERFMWQKMGIAPMQLRGCDLRQAAARRHDAPLQFRSRLHGSEKTLLIRSVCGIRRRLGFALVRYLRIGFVGGFAKRLLVRLALLLLGQNDRMVHDDAAIERPAYVDVVLIVVMHGQRIDLRVREAVAAALLDIVQNKGDAVVEVFMLFGTGGREKRIRACTLLQIFPDRIPEMFARFCHNGVGFG